MIHDFNFDLQYSLEGGKEKELNDFYFSLFPHLKEIKKVEDIKLQLQGIDKILVMDYGKEVLIDEKIRRKDYGDILLEEYSNFETKKIGWLSRKKLTDYIVYYIQSIKTVYLLPFLVLQLVWIKNYEKWLRLYGRKFAQNNGYKTSNIAIPTQVLLLSIKQELTQPVGVRKDNTKLT